MAYTNTIAILIQAKDEATAVLKATAKGVEETSGKLNALASGLTDVGGAMTKGLTLPAAVAGLAGLKMAANFQQSMELIRTQAGASQQEVDSMTKSVLAMAPSVGQGPDKLAKALFFVESSGYRGAAALEVLRLAAEGANVGQADLSETANALTSVLNTHIVGAENASIAMGNLNAIVGAGKMHFDDLNAAIGTGFVNTAKLFGVSLDSVGAALDQLTLNGEPAANAATRLSMMITLMGAPTNQAAKVLSGIGFSANEVQASTSAMTEALAKAHVTTNDLAADMRQPNGINVAIQDLKTHMVNAGIKSEDAGAIIARAFGGGRTSKPIQALVEDTQGLGRTFDQVSAKGGDFAGSVAAQNQMASQKFKDAWVGIEVQLIRLGNAVMPAATRGFTDLSNAIIDAAKWFDGLGPTAKTFFTDAAVALAVGGPILWGMGKLIGGIKDMKDLLDKAPGWWDAFSSAASGAFDKASSGATAAKDGIGNLASKLSDYAGTAWDAVHNFVRGAADTASAWATSAADTVKSAVVAAASTAKAWAIAGKEMIVNAVSATASMVANAARSALAWIVAAHESEAGLLGTLTTMVINSLEKTGEMIGHAIAVGATWIANAARASFAWVTVELPKIIKSFVLTSASAVKEAAVSGASWVKEAAVSSYAWVTVELPKIVKSFIVTSASAVKEAVISSAAWVKEAAVSAAAWVVQSARIVASFVATTAAAIANGITQTGIWIGLTAEAGAYGVAIDLVKGSLATLTALAAAPIVMGAILVAGALADIALVAKAVDSVLNAIDAMNQADKALESKKNSDLAAANTILAAADSGKISYSKAQKIFDSTGLTPTIDNVKFASGTNFAPGGMALVGEQGPELVELPRGSKVHTSQDTRRMSQGVTFNQTNHIYNNADMTAANREIGWRLAHA